VDFSPANGETALLNSGRNPEKAQMKKSIAQFVIRVSLTAWSSRTRWLPMCRQSLRITLNDYASLIDPQTAQQLDQRLEDFERQTSNRILVIIYPALPEKAALEDFAQDAFRAWKPGQRGRNNGAILFVFVKDRKMRIQIG
jgi:uncharacterized membrane protein YgcG